MLRTAEDGVMKILAINFGGIGDEVLFLPTIKSVKRAHPDWELTLLTEPRSKSITQLSRLIDANIIFDIKKVPLLPADYFELVSLLRKGKYDIVLSSGSSSKVCLLLFLSGIPRRIGYDSGALSRFLLSRAVKLNRQQYASYMYEELVSGLGIEPTYEAPEIDLDAEALARMKAMLAEQRKIEKPGKLVLVHPGTSRLAVQKGIIKHWSPENWSELIKKLLNDGFEVMLCGGPDDDETVQLIRAELERSNLPKQGFIDAFGKTRSLSDLAALMELSELIVCVDSAPMHVAAALKKNLVALFGPTDPKKLLLESESAVALTEETPSGASTGNAPCVRIPLDTVYHAALDQLNRVSSRENSPECRRS